MTTELLLSLRALNRLNPLVRLGWSRSSLILVNNLETMQALPRRHRAKVRVRPNACAAVDPGPPATPEEPPVAACVGRLNRFKGVSLAIRALVLAPEWQLLVIGNGPDLERLARVAREAGVEDRVRFAGALPQAEVWRRLRGCRALLLPSLKEGASFIAAEAQELGLPVIALDTNGPAALAQMPGASFELVPPGRTDEVVRGFAAALERVERGIASDGPAGLRSRRRGTRPRRRLPRGRRDAGARGAGGHGVRVLIVHNRYRSAQPSGENAVVEDEAQLLEEAGCTVRRVETHSDDIARFPLRKRALLPARVVWSRDGYRLTEDAIRDFQPDVVHFHNTFPLLSPAALWAAHRSGVGVVQTLHNFRPLCVSGSFFRDGQVCELCLGRAPLPALVHGCYRGSRAATIPLALKNTVHRSLGTWARCVDVFITPSDFARRKYVEAGWPESKIVVKPNTAPDIGSAKAQWHGSFTYVGRFGVEKGTDILLSAWAEAFPRGGPGLRMIGADADAAGEGAAEVQGVEFVGQVDRARALALVAGSRALVVPSRLYEVFPRVIVEAYALGVPVIAARIGPLPEIVEHGRTGLVFETGEAIELAQALATLARSDEAAQELGRGARLAYEHKYSPTRTTRS